MCDTVVKMNDIGTQQSEVNEPKCKKMKVDLLEDNCNDETVGKECTPLQSVFNDFKLINVLREDARQKLVTLHGSLDANDAVVLLERKAFDVSTIEKCLRQTKCEETLQNDIYSTFDLYSNGPFPRKYLCSLIRTF